MRGRPRTMGYTHMEPQEIGRVYRVPDVDFGGCFLDVKLAAGDPGQAAIKASPLRLAYRRPDLVDRLLAENPTIAGGLDDLA